MTADLPASPPTSCSFRVVLIAGAGDAGRDGAYELLDRIPPLTVPVIASVRSAGHGPLEDLADGADCRVIQHGDRLETASRWLAPTTRDTYVRNGAFELGDEHDGLPDEVPSLGKLYHSLRVDLGSRVFAVVIDAERADTPQLRLLAQRGARVVSPIDAGPAAVPRSMDVDSIVDYLGAAAGALRAPVPT